MLFRSIGSSTDESIHVGVLTGIIGEINEYASSIEDLSLIDYKVRILNTGTDATTRVSIESSDKNKKSWYTVGVSENIIEASFRALIDSVEYKLLKEKVAPVKSN